MTRKLIVLSTAATLLGAPTLAQQTPTPTPNQGPGSSPLNQCWDASTNQVRDKSQLPGASPSARETVGAGQQPAGVNESQRSPNSSTPGIAANRPANMPTCQ
jgi:hypothetical protein